MQDLAPVARFTYEGMGFDADVDADWSFLETFRGEEGEVSGTVELPLDRDCGTSGAGEFSITIELSNTLDDCSGGLYAIGSIDNIRVELD